MSKLKIILKDALENKVLFSTVKKGEIFSLPYDKEKELYLKVDNSLSFSLKYFELCNLSKETPVTLVKNSTLTITY